MNDDNVFAPGGDHVREASVPSPTATPREQVALLARAVSLVGENFGVLFPVLGALLVVGLVSLGVGVVSGVAQGAAPDLAGGISLGANVVTLLISLVQMYLSVGFVKMLLALDRGESTTTDVMLEQMPTFGSALVAYFLMGVVMIPVVLLWMAVVLIVPGAVFLAFGTDGVEVMAGAMAATTGWAVLLLSPLFYVTGGLAYILPLLVDSDVSPVESLTGSWQMTTGHRLFLVGQQWILLGIVLACYCFTCGLALPFLSLLQLPLQVVTFNAIRTRNLSA